MSKKKYASNSFGKDYECKQEWPEDCFVQCGDNGLVLNKDSLNDVFGSNNPIKSIVINTSYITAFFEAFPNNPNTFIRGEGKTVEEAEQQAFNKFTKYSKCPQHEFERKGYTNGAGFCKYCGMFASKVFEPTTKCCICNSPTNYSCNQDDTKWYCEKHIDLKPESEMHEFEKKMRKRKKL